MKIYEYKIPVNTTTKNAKHTNMKEKYFVKQSESSKHYYTEKCLLLFRISFLKTRFQSEGRNAVARTVLHFENYAGN